MKRVSFIHMADGTAEDYRIIGEAMKQANEPVADDVLALLQENERIDLGYQVTRFEHSLQAATHAFRDGQDEEMVVAALLHDVGDTLSPFNHAQVAAGILRPYVSERTYWVVLHHGFFQTYYYNHHFGRDRNARDHLRATRTTRPASTSAPNTTRTPSIRTSTPCRSRPSSRWSIASSPAPPISTWRPRRRKRRHQACRSPT